MQSKMPDCCAAANCNQKSDQSDIAFFSFPLDPERCKQWLNNCQRPDLGTKTPEQLHQSYKLCAKHFDSSLLCQEGNAEALKDGAVPTIFDIKFKPEPQTYRRKRPGEPIAGEPGDVKKSKDGDLEDLNLEINREAGENSAGCEPLQDDMGARDDPHSKGKEILKLYFKETLALTGFSIGNNTSLSVAGSLSGQGTQLKTNRLCDEKVDKKEVMKFGEDLMREEIRTSLRHARFFSILLQDMIRIEGKEQIPVFVRTVTDIGFPQKHLIGFLPCDVDCESLFYMLLSEIRNKWGLRMEHCRGLTYLTTGAICQKMKELSSRILRDFPQVVLAPSDPYAFNMWLIRSMPMLSIQNVMSAVEEVAGLLREIPLLWTELELKIFSTYSHIKGEVDRIKDSCQGRWEYGINAFQTMLDILEPFLSCLSGTSMKVELESRPDTAEQVAKLKQVLRNFNFIMTLVVLKNTLCCVSILNPSLRGTISISSTLQYTISNALKLLNKYLQEIAIHHRKWFSDAVGRAKKLGVTVALPEDATENSQNAIESQASLEDYYRESLCRKVLHYLVDEVKRVFSTEMVRILRWLSLVPSYMADHNFSIRRDKVADANLNNLSRPDTFYDELGCWEVKWRHASKRRILPTTVFATLKIPDIGFYPNVQSLLRVLGTIPCVNAEADVYGQYDMVLDRYHTYMRETPADQRLCNTAFVYVNQDVHMNMEAMVESYVEKHPDMLQLLEMDNEVMETEPSAPENDGNGDGEETQMVLSTVDMERPKQTDCSETNKEALKSALQSAVTATFSSHNKKCKGSTDESESGTEYVSKSEMKEVLRVCEDAVREGILSEVGNSFFSLFIDRIVRMGEVDYLPLFLRFVDSFDVMRLELLGFVETDLDCETMSERLFDLVTSEWRLDLKYCRGQAYLGSGEVSYKLKAFACKVQEKHPLAICSYSSCYSFNTWWSRSIPVSSITRALDVLEEVMLFFGSTPALEKQLDQVIGIGLRESFEKIHELQGKFCSVWMEKHDCYEVFVQMLEPLVECLEKIHLNKPQRWKVAESNKAGLLLRLLQDFDFILPMVALKNASSFTRELSAGLQKDHFSAASQLCQISGIVATLNRVKTNIKVFHQNWFEEACALAQSLRVQIKLPDSAAASRDGMVKPATYYKEMLSMPLVDNLISAVKDHFSDDHKEALNFLSLVPCSVTVSYMFEILKSKPPLYINDLPDPDNFSTELSCWRVKWKTKMVAVTIPDTIFQTLRLPVMQYFANIATLLRIMCVLPSTALEFCGETTCHSKYQDYLKNTVSAERTPCLAMLQVGTNFSRDLDRMVAQCLKITPKTLEGICLDQESKNIMKNSEINAAVEYNTEDGEEFETHLTTNVKDEQGLQAIDTNGHSGDNRMSARRLFHQAARLARKGTLLSSLPREDQDALTEELSLCQWSQADDEGSIITDQEFLEGIVKSIREAILEEVHESPFFSVIIDKVVTVALKRYLPVFVRYVSDYTPKVELLGFLPLSDNCQGDSQAKTLSQTLTDDWGLQMSSCRGQAYMRSGPECQSLRKLSLDFLESYPLAVVTPSESCGLAHWLAGSLQCDQISSLLGIVEDLLQFFAQSPTLESKLAETVDGLLNTPREAFEDSPETCCSRWRKREDFFDALVDTLEGILSCLDSVNANSEGIWSSTMALHAGILATAIRGTEFVVTLVILKNACSPLKNCSTVFRCGNPADIICELEKIPLIIESLNNMLANVDAVHSVWFEQAIQMVTKVSGLVIFAEMAGLAQSPEVHYRETITFPVLTGLIEEMKYNFSDDHLKALKVLSLLPTCGPPPVVPESPDQLHIIFQDELPEPDTAEQDFNTWATAWREKYQEFSPPASISETLVHTESKSNPNVTTLLKRVAVLPSVSMECDLMKSSLNSLRVLLKNTVCRGSRTDTVMLLSHRPVFHLLEEIIDKCIDGEPESQSYLTKVKQRIDSFKLKSELTPLETNGSCKPEVDIDGCQVKVKDEHPVIKMEAASENSVVQRPVFSFYSPSVREEILKELWDSQFFTVIIEQDVDIDSEPHVPICIRYLDKQDTQCEESLAFIPVSTDVKAFVDCLEAVLSEKWGLNMAFCRGLSLLCTGSVGAQMKMALTLFSQRYSQVICTLSSAVSLNVWLARSSPVAIMGTRGHLSEELLQWFTADVQRQARLEDTIVSLFVLDEAKGNELRDKLNCKHWERSHNTLDFMVDILEAVTLCLGEMRHGTSGQERRDVLRFYDKVQDFKFIFTVVALKNILNITKNTSQGLLGKPLDMLNAVNNLPVLSVMLDEVKMNLDSCHQTWFTEAVTLASKLQIHLLHPALLEPLSGHYREAVSRVAVEKVITEIGELFPDHITDVMRCLQVVPYVLSKTGDNCLDVGLVNMFREDLPDLASFSDEVQKWKAKWTDSMGAHLYLPSTVLDTLKVSDIMSFSNVEMLLRILVVLPFSRRESTFRQGRRALQEFMQQSQRKLSELHPL
ncbi:hypothetical protein AALO_G00024850 [Alosa alosa]|uniref:THAP-type domain-containing protein n=1 Tax=Alosa alosa TaxID=278164 RepID=A0AAV6HE10_9TELE|nr:uncharacterized protein si:dkey-250d21.1 [Alosa alosa]KAG5284270.1 hypothetical protein AALO_G00024850 [Alosa alosa]